jgi:hypothetical protein
MPLCDMCLRPSQKPNGLVVLLLVWVVQLDEAVAKRMVYRLRVCMEQRSKHARPTRRLLWRI